MPESDLTELAEQLDRSVAAGHLPDPAYNPWIAGISRNAADSRAYLWALRSRLIALGYLGEKGNRHSDQIDPRFVAAVRRFQGDIGERALRADGWAGPKTWAVLQSLVSFEDGQEPRFWNLGIELEDCPAVARAAYLRLWVMGFFPDWERFRLRTNVAAGLDNPQFRTALARFLGFAQALGLGAGDPAAGPALDLPTLSLLFNHDRIVASLASERFAAVARFDRQLDAIARIELWLHGYDCEPGPPTKRTYRRGPPGRQVTRRVSSQQVAIRAFWQDADGTDPTTDSVSRSLFAEFAGDLDSAPPDQDQIDRVVAAIDGLNERDSQTFTQRLAALGSAIWDGVRRMVKAIGRFLRRAGRSVETMLKNLARLVARQARRYFHLFVRAVDVVQGGVDYLRNTSIPRELPAEVFVWRGADFDHRLMMAPDCSAAASGPFETYRLRSAQFDAASVIIGESIEMLRAIAAAATGALAGPLLWLRAMLALGKIRHYLDDVREALATLDQYEVTGTYQQAVMRFDVA